MLIDTPEYKNNCHRKLLRNRMCGWPKNRRKICRNQVLSQPEIYIGVVGGAKSKSEIFWTLKIFCRHRRAKLNLRGHDHHWYSPSSAHDKNCCWRQRFAICLLTTTFLTKHWRVASSYLPPIVGWAFRNTFPSCAAVWRSVSRFGFTPFVLFPFFLSPLLSGPEHICCITGSGKQSRSGNAFLCKKIPCPASCHP